MRASTEVAIELLGQTLRKVFNKTEFILVWWEFGGFVLGNHSNFVPGPFVRIYHVLPYKSVQERILVDTN